MINERPLVPSEIASQLEMKDLLRMVKEKGANLPSNWEKFDEKLQRSAVASFLRGGLTKLGFESLTPDWLEKINEIADDAKQSLDFMEDLEPKSDKEVS